MYLNNLLQGEQESLNSLFQLEGNDEVKKANTNHSKLHVEVSPWLKLPRYASHLRISSVKIPECGMLGSLKGASKSEEDDRQFMIDSDVNEYFKIYRFFARGDIFYIHIDWNYGSEMCTACSQDFLKRFSSNKVYFKVPSLQFLSYQGLWEFWKFL